MNSLDGIIYSKPKQITLNKVYFPPIFMPCAIMAAAAPDYRKCKSVKTNLSYRFCNKRQNISLVHIENI